jgi:hypothetical protein
MAIKKATGTKNPKLSMALKGNHNASKHGARTGAAAALIGGIPGALAGGAIIGAAKRGEGASRAHNRAAKAAGIVGAVGGGLAGGALGLAAGHGKAGVAAGAAVGAAASGGLHYGASKLGTALTKGYTSNKSTKPRKKK